MTQETITISEKHKEFITLICETEVVFGLSDSTGFIVLDSNDFEDETGNPVGMICFWSTIDLAKQYAKKDWKNYEPATIGLSEFIENWCVGMYNDGLLAAIEFDCNLAGYEIHPLVLILEIIAKLETMGKTLLLTKFNSLSDLESQINIIFNAEEDYEI